MDYLADVGFGVWQVLPLVPPDIEYWSPYSGVNAFAGNTLLISIDRLVLWGLLAQADADALAAAVAKASAPANGAAPKCDFTTASSLKEPYLLKAADALLRLPDSNPLKKQFAAFKADPLTASWLPDAALFDAIASEPENDELMWWEWPNAALRDRDENALKAAANQHKERIERYEALQYLFHATWLELKEYANKRNVKLLGDIPIYVGGNSADVWANRSLFEMSKATGAPARVSGVPPDAFSADGQLWGSPLFDWKAQKEEGFEWWRRRIQRLLQLHDMVRIDHFRAFAGYWSIPADAETAKSGEWRQGPGEHFFDTLKNDLPPSKLICEDLGVITDDVNDLRAHIGAPGMVVLQFAFGGGSRNTHLPHNYEVNSVVYTGTHDNETTLGWYSGLSLGDKRYVSQYLTGGKQSRDTTVVLEPEEATRRLLGLAFGTAARTAIVPAQDLLLLPNETGRMNTPGVADGNWAYRLDGGVDALRSSSAAWMAEVLPLYRRGEKHIKTGLNIASPYEKKDKNVASKTASKTAPAPAKKGFFGRLFG